MKKKLVLLFVLILAGCNARNKSSSIEMIVSSSTSEEVTSIESSTSLLPSSDDPPSVESSETPPSSSEVSSEEPTSEEDGTIVQSFYHRFEQSDFTTEGGSVFINGLTFLYSPFSFLGGSVQGVQIGSRKNPQVELWELKTSFDENVIITSFYVELMNASSGSGVYSYSFGDYEVTEDFISVGALTKYGEENLNVPASDLTFTLKAYSRAIYFYSLSFSCITSINSSLKLTGDHYDPTPVVPGENSIPNTNYPQITKEEYYQDIDLNAGKETLLLELRTLVSDMTRLAYEDAKTMLQYADEHPVQKGYLYGAYDGDLIPAKWDQGASWNREHVWACAHMKLNGIDARPDEKTKSHASDLHNLRVACQLANGAHGNLYFDEVTNGEAFYPNISSGLVGYHAYEGDFRGDTARILFYMFVRYEGLKLTSNPSEIDDVSMGILSVLLAWNTADPVDDFEVQRNNRIYAYQGNRNPFIDYANLADTIFA